MEPITRGEIFMATAAGEYSGELPEPVTRSEFYWQKIAQRIDAGGSVSPEQIDTAIADYLNTHGADIVTEAELSEALEDKADSADIPDVSGFIDADVNNLTNYYDKDTVDAALAGKADTTATQTALDNKVDKITGKGLSEANFTDAEKTKLAGIAAGAEANVQSDWNQGDDAADDYIRNKPANLVQDASYVHTDNNFSNAEKAKADGAIQSTEKGVANGVAELNANGKVPTSQLPAYVDDVLSYNSLSDFPVAGEDGKIYIAKDTNLSYRWGSSEYVVISPSLALGSTSSTAYRGDWGAEDRAAIGTLSTLNTTEKSNLVGAINELKTASDAKQGTLDFDSAPTSGSTNPVTSGGVYTALAGKADATATQTALAGKADATATQTALAGKQNALTAGANITIETVNDVLTISATDTTYSNATTSAAGLMSAADFKKINVQNITSGSDLNDITNEGWYRCYTNAAVATFSNCPTTIAFYMEVHRHAGVYQHIVEFSVTGAKHYHRNYYDGVWGNWVEWKLTDTTYSNAIPSTNGVGGSAGLMSAADKEKLDKINIVVLTQAQYDAIASPDSSTLYLIPEEAEA